jgi:hypothetical protein
METLGSDPRVIHGSERPTATGKTREGAERRWVKTEDRRWGPRRERGSYQAGISGVTGAGARGSWLVGDPGAGQ